jgi:hypothetical protein
MDGLETGPTGVALQRCVDSHSREDVKYGTNARVRGWLRLQGVPEAPARQDGEESRLIQWQDDRKAVSAEKQIGALERKLTIAACTPRQESAQDRA